MNWVRRGLVVWVGLVGVCSVVGQSTAGVSAGKDAWGAEPLVIVKADTTYQMQSDGTGAETRTMVARIQSESTLKQLGVISLGFAAKSQHVEWMYARVRHQDGTVTETPVSGALEVNEAVTREAPFYSDLKESQLPLKDLRVGDQLEWEAKVVRTVAEAPGAFWGQQWFPKDVVVLEQTLRLEVPQGVAVTVWSPTMKPVESDAGGRHVWLWTSSNLTATVGAAADATKEADKKRVRTAAEELDEREGKLPDVAWTTFKSWAAVGAWYRGLEGERMVPDAEIKAKVAQLTAGKTTELEKVQAVYGYVATQIHYIGVAFGVGRYQPHSAADVLGNQYGDCKDKHTLLAAMLAALGLKPDAVLIGAGIRFNEAVPSPSAFNHLITRVAVDGKPIWLDTTAEVAPMGMLVYATRDKSALVVPDAGVAEVVKTPKMPPFPVELTMNAVGTLDADGTSVSRITMKFRGDDEVQMRALVRQISPAQYQQMAQGMCQGMGYAGEASHVEVGRAEDTSVPMEVSFDYKRVREKDTAWANLQMVPQLSPVGLPRPDEKDPPVESIALGVPRVEESKSAMKLPEGWGVEFPEAVHVASKWAKYDETYRLEKGTMYADRRIEVLIDRVPLAEWKEYNKFAVKADLGNEDFIQLRRLKKSGGDSASKTVAVQPAETGTPKADPDASVKELLASAYADLQKSDLTGAEGFLDQVKAKNPEMAQLWEMYGYVAFRKGEMAESVKDYQKAISLNPTVFRSYQALVATQLAMKQRGEAEETLRQWQEALPSDATPVQMLGALQMEDGKAADAVRIAGAWVKANPGSGKAGEAVELLLGRAQLKAGQKEEGHATLLGLLKNTESPDMMNNAGYELADAGLELPLVEAQTRTALDQMEDESRTWTLDEAPGLLQSRRSILQATWDTMGWIYFREGKVGEAESYVKASWTGRQSAEVGKHLGEIAEAKGDKAGALRDYLLALDTYPKYDAMGVHAGPPAAAKDLQDRIAALTKAGVKSASVEGGVQKLRMIPIGAAAGLNGVAEYRILVSGDAIVKAKPSGEKRLVGGEERLLKTKLAGFIPPASKANLAYTVMLNCHSGVCEVVIEQ